jgi:hypothetical protein
MGRRDKAATFAVRKSLIGIIGKNNGWLQPEKQNPGI